MSEYQQVDASVRVLSVEEKWTLVEWSNGKTGWVPNESLVGEVETI